LMLLVIFLVTLSAITNLNQLIQSLLQWLRID
jgi:hypothetical protein